MPLHDPGRASLRASRHHQEARTEPRPPGIKPTKGITRFRRGSSRFEGDHPASKGATSVRRGPAPEGGPLRREVAPFERNGHSLPLRSPGGAGSSNGQPATHDWQKTWPVSPRSAHIMVKHEAEETPDPWPSRRWAPRCGRSTDSSPTGPSPASPTPSSWSASSAGMTSRPSRRSWRGTGRWCSAVCRGILRDPNDAEDAFQAVFLVLVKKAGSIRGRVILGGWLYRVAHRVAIEANRAAARRREHERRAGAMAAVMTSSGGPTVPDELLAGPARGDRPAAREIPAAGRPLRPGGHAPGPGRRPVALERAHPPPSPRRGPRSAQDPADPPRPGARRRRARGGVRSARPAPPSRPPGTPRPSARRCTPSIRPSPPGASRRRPGRSRRRCSGPCSSAS